MNHCSITVSLLATWIMFTVGIVSQHYQLIYRPTLGQCTAHKSAKSWLVLIKCQLNVNWVSIGQYVGHNLTATWLTRISTIVSTNIWWYTTDTLLTLHQLLLIYQPCIGQHLACAMPVHGQHIHQVLCQQCRQILPTENMIGLCYLLPVLF